MNNRIFSLWDMLRLHAEPFVKALRIIAQLEATLAESLKEMKQETPHLPVSEDTKKGWESTASILYDECMRMGLATSSMTAKKLIDAISKLTFTKKQFKTVGDVLVDVMLIPPLELIPLQHLVRELSGRLQDELSFRIMLVLRFEDNKYYDHDHPLFGEDVDKKFPVAEDIAEAGKCLALSRYTASIFHLMRVLEVGTSKFAGLLGVTFRDIRGKDKNWQNFLDEANKAIAALPSHDQKTREYAEISANLYNVKLAWRNEVMHPKQTYTEDEALEVFAASKAFMRRLASVV